MRWRCVGNVVDAWPPNRACLYTNVIWYAGHYYTYYGGNLDDDSSLLGAAQISDTLSATETSFPSPTGMVDRDIDQESIRTPAKGDSGRENNVGRKNETKATFTSIANDVIV